MKRYMYDSILKGVFNFFGGTLIFFSIIYFVLAISIDRMFNVTSLIFIGSGFILIIIGYSIRLLLRIVSKCCVLFEDGKIYYKGKCFYNCTIKYVKFYMHIFEPILVIPKLYVNNGKDNLVMYLTKRDIKKLVKKNYNIEVI